MYVYMCVCVKGMRTKNVRKWERIQPLKEGDQAREDNIFIQCGVCVLGHV